MIKLNEVISQPGKEMNLIKKNVYGNNLIYPNCELSQFAANLTRKKTLDNSDIKTLKNMGYIIKIDGVSI